MDEIVQHTVSIYIMVQTTKKHHKRCIIYKKCLPLHSVSDYISHHFYAMNSYLNITSTLHCTRTCAISADVRGGYFVDIQIVRQYSAVIFPSRRCIDRLIGRSCAYTCRSVGYSISSMSNLLTRMCNTLRIYLSRRRLSYHNMGQSYTTRTL